MIVFSPRCPQIIRPIWKVASSLAFLAARPIALNAVVQSAAPYTRLEPSSWLVL